MLGLRTFNSWGLTIGVTKQRVDDLLRCADKGINRIDGTDHSHFFAVRFGCLISVMSFNRHLRARTSKGNALAISAHHAQSAFGLRLWSRSRLAKSAHSLGHLQVHALKTIGWGFDVKDASQRLGHATISMFNRQALAPILEQIGKVTLG